MFAAISCFSSSLRGEGVGFVGDALKARSGELAQDGSLARCFLYCWVLVAEPVLHPMNPSIAVSGVGRAIALSLGLMRLNQVLSWRDLIHLAREWLVTDLLALGGVFGVGRNSASLAGKPCGSVQIFFQN